MMECLSSLDFWIQATVHVGIVLFVLGSIALVQLIPNRVNNARLAENEVFLKAQNARLAQRESSSLTKNRPLVRSQ